MERPDLIVVDDDPEIASLVATLARNSGFEVRIAEGARAFLALYAERPPDAIVLDIVMPDMDGIELMERLSRIGCNVPLLIISGYDGRYLELGSAFARSKGLPLVNAMQKPLDAALLQQELKQMSEQVVPGQGVERR